MRKFIKFKVIIISVLLILIGIIGYKGYTHFSLQKLINTPISELTEEQKLEDFEFLYDTLAQNYPLLEVNKRKYGVDWLANKDEYIELIKTTNNFKSAINIILNDLNDEHTDLLDEGLVKYMRTIYKNSKENGYWQGILFDTLNHPLVINRYNIDIEVEEYMNDNNANNFQVYENAIVGDIVDEKVASIYIPSMINSYAMDKDIALIENYLQDIKDYQALVIDIRGNGGGDSAYWSKFLLPQILKEDIETENYVFYKGVEIIENFLKTKGIRLDSINDLDLSEFPNLPPEIINEFKYYEKLNIQLSPAENSIEFSGNIYLLVDSGVYSSAEKLATFAKSTGFATIIGEQTKGSGIGADPFIAMLPNSGYAFRFTGEIGTTSDGTSSEEHPTMPDYIVEDATRIKDILPKYLYKYDDCIQKVLELEDIDVIEN